MSFQPEILRGEILDLFNDASELATLKTEISGYKVTGSDFRIRAPKTPPTKEEVKIKRQAYYAANKTQIAKRRALKRPRKPNFFTCQFCRATSLTHRCPVVLGDIA